MPNERLNVLKHYLDTPLFNSVSGLLSRLDYLVQSGETLDGTTVERECARYDLAREGAEIRLAEGQIWLRCPVIKIGEERIGHASVQQRDVIVCVTPPQGRGENCAIQSMQFHGQFDLLYYLTPILRETGVEELRGQLAHNNKPQVVRLSHVPGGLVDAHVRLGFPNYAPRPRPGQRSQPRPGQRPVRVVVSLVIRWL